MLGVVRIATGLRHLSCQDDLITVSKVGPKVPEITDLFELCAIFATYLHRAFILIDGHVLTLRGKKLTTPSDVDMSCASHRGSASGTRYPHSQER